MCKNPPMRERDAVQAEVLVLASGDLRDKMISHVNWLERHGSPLPPGYGPGYGPYGPPPPPGW
jgi:hypothetical protein